MHADVKASNMLVVEHLGKLIDFGFSMSYADLLKGNYSPLMAESLNYPYWPGVLRELVDVGLDEKITELGQSMDDNNFDPEIVGAELLELLESTDKHGFARTLVGGKTIGGETMICEDNIVKSNPTWQMFKDLSKTRSVKCRNKSEFVKHDPYLDNPFFSWPAIFANLQAYTLATFGVQLAPLDEHYLDAMLPAKLVLEQKIQRKAQQEQEEVAAHKAQQEQATALQTLQEQEVRKRSMQEQEVVQESALQDVVQEGALQEQKVMQKRSIQEQEVMQEGAMQKVAVRTKPIQAMQPPSQVNRKTKRHNASNSSKRSRHTHRPSTPAS